MDKRCKGIERIFWHIACLPLPGESNAPRPAFFLVITAP